VTSIWWVGTTILHHAVGRMLRPVLRGDSWSVLAALGHESAPEALRSCVGGGVPEAENCVRLGTFLALDDVELYIIALFQCLVAVQLNCRVVDEHIGAVIATDESVALGVVKPLDFAFVLSHRLLPFRTERSRRRTQFRGTLTVCSV